MLSADSVMRSLSTFHPIHTSIHFLLFTNWEMFLFLFLREELKKMKIENEDDDTECVPSHGN